MLRMIALFAAFYWMAVFAMLAVASAIGAAAPLLGGGIPVLFERPGAMPALSTAFLLGFAVVAALFLWCFVTVLAESTADDSDSVMRAAFGSAAGMLGVLVIASAAHPEPNLLPALSIQFAALMASYAAIDAEKRAVAAAAGIVAMDDVRVAAKRMARNAAHDTLLRRFSGRAARQAKEGGPR